MRNLWKKLVRPVMFALDAERAHEIGIEALKLGIMGSNSTQTFDEFGDIERFCLKFANPLGIAAGFDKNGVVVNQLASLGFGFVEVGTVTYEPQSGNSKPRLFRLKEDNALINKLGFNNDGATAVVDRVRKLERKCVVGVNIGKNKNVPNEEATENYLNCFEAVYPVADYVVINVSSPNTPALRELQRAEQFDELISALQSRNRVLTSNSSRQTSVGKEPEYGFEPRPLLVKISPDVTDGEIEAIVDTSLKYEISGIIATNTTISREGLMTSHLEELGAGGLSGKPLAKRSTEVISKIYRYSTGKIPIIGVGGIFSAQDAFEKIEAGACLIQAYTGFVYNGPGFAEHVNLGLAAILKERGFKSLDDAVGSKAVKLAV